MKYKVFLTRDAIRDLGDIYGYIAEKDSINNALHVMETLEQQLQKLEEFLERGNFPHELLNLGIKEYREVFFKPYRIIYRIMEKSVYVFCIADGRRDMQTLLDRRLLSAD